MKRWEYKYITIKHGEDIIAPMNAAGLEGWEYTGDSSEGNFVISFFMKREVPSSFVIEQPKTNLFHGEQTAMVYTDYGHGRCRVQDERYVQSVAEKSPGAIYYFLEPEHAQYFLESEEKDG